MNKEKLNKIMNCECLQSIIESDKKRCTINSDTFGYKVIRNPKHGYIKFSAYISFEEKVIDDRNRKFKNNVIKDRNEWDDFDIPILFCPICGTKSKHNIPENSYYHQFQNNR